MAPAAVRFHPAAAQEAESAYDWYAARNPAVAHGFLEELRHAVAAVAENPRAWLRYGDRARRYVFPRFPFSLVYVLRAVTWRLACDASCVVMQHGGDGGPT